MEPGAEIAQLVDEMEQLLEEAKSPLTGGAGRKIIEVNDFYEILDEMRSVFPDEFQTARRIIKEEQETLDRAQQQANSIIADAQQQAMILAGDQEVVRLAQQQADAIRDQADQYERDTRYNAEEYADQHGDPRAPDARRELRPAQHHQQRPLVARHAARNLRARRAPRQPR